MTYDQWKSRDPEYYYEPDDPTMTIHESEYQALVDRIEEQRREIANLRAILQWYRDNT